MNTPAPLTIDYLDDENALVRLKSIWQALERKDVECSPFNTWDWASLWWTHYAVNSRYQLAIVIARRDARVVGIAPMYIRKERNARLFPVHVLRFIGSGCDTSPDYLNFICEPGERAAAESAIFKYLFTVTRWQKMLLTDVRKESSLSHALQQHQRWQKVSAQSTNTRTIYRADLPDSWESYRGALSRKRRKQINHRHNRLNAAGVAELSLCSNQQELQAATTALIDLHRLRWQSKGQPGGFQTKAYVAFHTAVIETFFNRHALWLATLKLDERIIGVQYIFLWRGELLYFQSGYSPEHESLSPGHVLFTYTIERAIEQGLTAIDMLKGDYGYKTAYARQTVETCDHQLIKPGLHSMLQQGKRIFARATRHASSSARG